jgi:hypothetical protein
VPPFAGKHYQWRVRKARRQRSFYLAHELSRVSLLGSKDDIAALNISFDILTTDVLKTLFQIGHLDDVASTDIDATQQGKV